MSFTSKEYKGAILVVTGSAPDVVPTGYIAIYASGSNGKLYIKNSEGTETEIG